MTDTSVDAEFTDMLDRWLEKEKTRQQIEREILQKVLARRALLD